MHSACKGAGLKPLIGCRLDLHDAPSLLAYPVDREGYDAIRAEVEAKTCRYKMVDVEFEPQAFFADPEAYNAELVQRLYA